MSLRLSNVYDLSSKILLFKFAKPENKKQLIIDTGFRCHLTEFARTTAAAPSVFVARLRKCLKTRRVTSVSQVGTDRILEFGFSDGQFRLFLEFFAVCCVPATTPTQVLQANSLIERKYHPDRCRSEDHRNLPNSLRVRGPGAAKGRPFLLSRQPTELSGHPTADQGACAKRAPGGR